MIKIAAKSCTSTVNYRIGFLSPEEQVVWALDQKINDRGLHVDSGLIAAAIRIAKTAKEKINAEIEALTESAVTTVNQTQRLMAWLEAHGFKVADVQKETLRRALTRKDIPPETRWAMELRLDGAHASANKFAPNMGVRSSPVAHYLILQNRLYRGEIAHKGNSYSGAIVDKPLWDEIQAVLAANRVERTTGARRCDVAFPTLNSVGDGDVMSDLEKVAAIGAPILPRPMKPTSMTSSLVYASFAVADTHSNCRAIQFDRH